MNYSVLIVTRNSESVYSLLTDLWMINDENMYSVHVIDNGSTDSYISELESVIHSAHDMSTSTFKFHSLEKNWLYGRANNYGIKYVMDNEVPDVDYIVICNPDIRYGTHKAGTAITNIIEDMQKEKAMIAGPKLKYPGSNMIEFAGGINNSHRGFQEEDHGQYDKIETSPTIEWITGAFMIIDVNLIRKIGYPDVREYTHWCSDQEFCRRAVLCGYKIMYHPLYFFHDQGKSSSYDPHKEVQKGLPKNVEPNIIPFSLDHIKNTALINSTNIPIEPITTEER